VKRIELYYDFSCPYAYLAHTQIEALAARTGAELVRKPFLLGGVFRALGTPDVPMTAMSPAKARQNALDMVRWADWFGVPLHMPTNHPNRTVLALRAVLASDDLALASKALFAAYWERAEDVSEPEVVVRALDRAGFDGATLVALADGASVRDELRARTDDALATGVFGAPALVVTVRPEPGEDLAPCERELYWGQDRLAMVERRLGGAPPLREVAASLSSAPSPFALYYDVSSPFAYLGLTQAQALAERSGATLELRPMLLGGLFRELGTPNAPLLAASEPKRRNYLVEMERWAAHWGVPLRFPTRFPMNTVRAMRMVLAAPEASRLALSLALARAYWVDDDDLADVDVLRDVATRAGLDGAALVTLAEDDSRKAELRKRTEEARQRGVCGAPTWLVGDELFWGQDRLDFVEAALRGWRSKPVANLFDRP
jgi:2-hydroxychromene-2-carboxylate isomerase